MIDNLYLDRLTGHLGNVAVSELLADGLIELADRIERVRAAAEQGDTAAVAELTHDIIAVAGHMGLSAMSAAAAEVNRLVSTPDADPMALIQPLLGVSGPSLKALSQRVDDARPA